MGYKECKDKSKDKKHRDSGWKKSKDKHHWAKDKHSDDYHDKNKHYKANAAGYRQWDDSDSESSMGKGYEEAKNSKHEKCTKEYNPLCCDGKDYDNPCYARNDGWDKYDKKCEYKECKNKKKSGDGKKKYRAAAADDDFDDYDSSDDYHGT